MPIFPVFPIDVVGAAQAVPTSLTSISTTDSLIYQMDITNPTAGAITFTLQDGQGSAVSVFSAQSIPAGGAVSIDERQGMLLRSGVRWQAGGAGLVGSYSIKRRQ